MSTSHELPEALKSQLEYFTSHGVGPLEILQSSSIVPFLPSSRQDTRQSLTEKDVFVSQDTLFHDLLNSEKAIPHLIGFHEDPFRYLATTFPHLPFITETVSLVLDVRDGLYRFNSTLHGGITCAIIDEAMGSLIFQNYVLNRQARAKGLIPLDSKPFAAAATARMDVKYRRPISTPQIVMVTASLERIEGRRIHMHVVIKNKDNQECASCDGVFVSIPNVKL
ncbi:HotDog domain-containing protein [Hypomontagnella monticulosa]|nr:HotDog domain-containing protein [Hypomontagnella monticulosa]